MSGGSLRNRLDQFLGSGGASSGGSSLRDRLNAFRQPQPDEPQVGVTLEGLDTEREAQAGQGGGFKPWTQPGDAGSPTVTDQTAPSDQFQRPALGGSEAAQQAGLDGLNDAAHAAAGGVYSSIGVNPGQAFGQNVNARLAAGNARSPMPSMVGKLGGEALMQGMALPARLGAVASGAVSGGLSAIGDTAGGAWDKTKAGVQGLIQGGSLAGLLHGAGKFVGAAEDPLARSANRSYLRQGGGTTGDLNAFDKNIPGGAQGLAERMQDQNVGNGFMAGPGSYQNDAQKLIDTADTGRTALAQGAPQIDRAALTSAVTDAGNQGVPNTAQGLPGRIRANVATEAGAMSSLNPGQPGVSFGEANNYRKLLGDKTNWANDPNANDAAFQRMHGALNGEMSDALTLQNPGAGEQWRNFGRNERDAIAMQQMAARGENRGGGGITVPSAASGVAGLLRSNSNAIAKNVANAGAGFAANTGAAAPVAAAIGGTYGGEKAAGADPVQSAMNYIYSPSQGAELGPYKALFMQAAGSGDKDAMKALVQRLTMTDTDFRTNVLPLLGGQR